MNVALTCCLFWVFVMMTRVQDIECDDTRFRLVDGHQNSGVVQIRHNGTWIDVCYYEPDGTTPWSFENATNICTQLGYPGTLQTSSLSSGIILPVNGTPEDYICSKGVCFPRQPEDTKCPNDLYVLVACAVPGYVGCFKEYNANARLLPDHPLDMFNQSRYTSDEMTIQKCIDICQDLRNSMRYAGLHAGSECYCGTDEREATFRLFRKDDSDCNYPCAGDVNEVCGGESRLSIYNIIAEICDDPGFPDNGFIKQNGTFGLGDVVSFGCDSNFILNGSASIQCVLEESHHEPIWNSSIPTCEAEVSITTQKMTTIMTTSITTAVTKTGARILSTSMMSVATEVKRARSLSTLIISATTTIANKNSALISIGAGLGGAIVGLIVVLLLIYAMWSLARKKRQGPSSTGKPASYESSLADVDAGPKSSTAHNYADIRNASVQLSTISEIEKNNSHSTETEDKKPLSDQSYNYADIKEEKTPGRKGSEHLYAYADVKDFNKGTPDESDQQTSSTHVVEDQEGWSDNVIYTESGPDKDTELSHDNHVDQEGWSDNILYVESNPAKDKSHDKDIEVKTENENEGWVDNSVYDTSDGK